MRKLHAPAHVPWAPFLLTLAAAACAAGTDEGLTDVIAADPWDDPAPPDGLDAPEGGDGTPESSDPAESGDEEGGGDWLPDESPDTPDDPPDSVDSLFDPYVETDFYDEETWPDVLDPAPDTIDGLDGSDTVETLDTMADEVAEEAPPDEVWMEISYQYRSTSESPTTADWSYSSTPGWTAAQWAPSSASWPYIHVPDGGSLVSDPIGGTVLELGCYDRFRLFFGLEELSHVGYATVTLEGRSRATSAGVDIEIWNPGASSSIVSYASMSQDWTADIVTVDFTAEAGTGLQAVEIAPIARSCSLALRRVRLTLYTIY